jgi:Abortive infection alpha/Protein of unknown function (DUF2806)
MLSLYLPLHKLAGPAVEEVGLMIGDRVKVYRIKNLIATTQKTRRILEDAGLLPNAVPSRLLLPIMDTCSVEDNEDLQQRWAGLLASASQESDSFSPSFVETLKQLTPREAKLLDRVSDWPQRSQDGSIPYQAFEDGLETRAAGIDRT